MGLDRVCLHLGMRDVRDRSRGTQRACAAPRVACRVPCVRQSHRSQTFMITRGDLGTMIAGSKAGPNIPALLVVRVWLCDCRSRAHASVLPAIHMPPPASACGRSCPCVLCSDRRARCAVRGSQTTARARPPRRDVARSARNAIAHRLAIKSISSQLAQLGYLACLPPASCLPPGNAAPRGSRILDRVLPF